MAHEQLHHMLSIIEGEEPQITPNKPRVPRLLKTSSKLIYGPYTLTEHYSAQGNKRIFIFGERHVFKTKKLPSTTKIADFIHHIVSQHIAETSIDIFLELAYPTGKSSYYIKDLGEIRDALSLISHFNLRVHYSDMRFIQKEMATFTIVILGLYHILTNLKNNSTSLESGQILINQLIRTLQSARSGDLIDFLIFQSDIKGKIYKQLANSSVSNEILGFLNNYLTKRGFTKEKLLFALESFSVENAETLAVDLILWHGVILDVCVLARIFRTFNHKPNKYSGSPTNVIVYVGNYHAECQREFLSSIGFKEIRRTEGTEDYINISQFKPSLF